MPNTIQDQGQAKINLTESLAMALCLQLSEEYSYLMERFQIKDNLLFNNYHTKGKNVHPIISSDRNAFMLMQSIIRKYTEYANFLKEKTYYGQEEEQS